MGQWWMTCSLNLAGTTQAHELLCIMKPSFMKANYEYEYQYDKIIKHALCMKLLCISKVK